MRKIVAKTGSYTDASGQQKNRWTNVGRIMSNDKGEFIVLNADVSLAGLLAIQNASSGQSRDGVLCSIFDNDNRQQQPAQSQQAPQQQQNNSAPSDFDNLPF